MRILAFQFLNISFCYTLFCFYLNLVNRPLRTLLWPGRGPDFQFVVFAAMVTSYARSSSSIKAQYLHPTKLFILWTRSSVRQANRIIQLEIYENQLEFSKASMNAKGTSSAALLAINRPYVSSNHYCCKSSNSPIFLGRGKKICDWTPPNQGQMQGDYGPPPSTADLRQIYSNCKLHI